MQCIYGHQPGTCDCMLTDTEIEAARAALVQNNEAARAARAALDIEPKGLEQRLFERARRETDAVHSCAPASGSRISIGAAFFLMMTVFFLLMINVVIRAS